MINCNNVVSGIQAIWVGGERFPVMTECIVCNEKTEFESHKTVCLSCKRQIKLNEVLGIENSPFIKEETKKDKNSHIPNHIQNRLKRRNK